MIITNSIIDKNDIIDDDDIVVSNVVIMQRDRVGIIPYRQYNGRCLGSRFARRVDTERERALPLPVRRF